MPGDESVIAAFSDDVMTMPVTSSVSIARRPRALPLWRPRETIRAAVRCATPMPSPSRKMMFCAGAAAPRGRPGFNGEPHAGARAVGGARLDHERPGLRDAERAQEEVRRVRRCPAGASQQASAQARSRRFRQHRARRPSPDRGCCGRSRPCRSRGPSGRAAASAPSLVASTRTSKRCPAASTAPSGGMIRIVVSALAVAAIPITTASDTLHPAALIASTCTSLRGRPRWTLSVVCSVRLQADPLKSG